MTATKEVGRGDRKAGCRCWAFEMDLYEDGEAVEGWYGPKCPHHPPVEVTETPL